MVARNLVCEVCEKTYVGRSQNSKYCSVECRGIAYPNLVRKEEVKRSCVQCGHTFYTTHSSKKTCSALCAEGYRQDRIRLDKRAAKAAVQEAGVERGDRPTKKSKYLFCNEDDFSFWFGKSYWLFGLKRLLKHDAYFPDVIALSHDDKVLRIELEYNADNYKHHGHPYTADLIISMIGNVDTIGNIPVISLFYSNEGNLHPTRYMDDVAAIGQAQVAAAMADRRTYYESINCTFPVDECIEQQEKRAS